MKSNIITKASMATVAAASCFSNSAAQSQQNLDQQRNGDRPNIVLVISEDLSPRWGCYGDKVANTPNLDALAREGVLFTNVHTMAGVSSPSRSGLITGVFQNFDNLHEMRSCQYKRPDGTKGNYFAVPPSNIKAYPELLRRDGYYTYCNTKFDYEFSGPSDPGAFSIWNAWGDYNNLEDQKLNPMWRTLPLDGRPFMFNYNPQITHESGLFDSEDPDLQKWYKPSAEKWDEFRAMFNYEKTNPKKVSVDPFYLDTKNTRKEIARFYDNITIMDQQVGQLIADLKADGLWDNTIFIVTTDHGDCLPRAKRDGYISSTHVPMIRHIPAKYRPDWLPADGSSCDRMISFEDLTPTMLGFAGTEIPSHMRGIDLSKDNPRERQYVFANRARQAIAQWNSYFVANKQYQYVRNLTKDPNGKELDYRNAVRAARDLNKAYKDGTLAKLRPEMVSWFEERPTEELYDLTKDPNEFHNVINDPAYSEIVKQFRNTLDEWRDQGNDGTLIPEERMRAELLDSNGQQRATEQPIITQDEVNHKVYVTNITENASIGYSTDGGRTWDLYTKALSLPTGTKLMVKAVRYGWKECKSLEYTVR